MLVRRGSSEGQRGSRSCEAATASHCGWSTHGHDWFGLDSMIDWSLLQEQHHQMWCLLSGSDQILLLSRFFLVSDQIPLTILCILLVHPFLSHWSVNRWCQNHCVTLCKPKIDWLFCFCFLCAARCWHQCWSVKCWFLKCNIAVSSLMMQSRVGSAVSRRWYGFVFTCL